MRSVWDNKAAAAQLTRMPISFHVALQDEMVPASQMYALFAIKQEAGDACPWELHEYTDAHHMDIFSVSPRQYWSSLQRFLARFVDRAGAGGDDDGQQYTILRGLQGGGRRSTA